MRAYLAGRRTGIKDYNREEFISAAAALRARNVEVISPVELDDGMSAAGDGSPLAEADYLAGLERCIVAMLGGSIDAVIVLPGWEQSRGAGVEVRVAQEFGKAILRYPGLEPIVPTRHPASARFHAILRGLGELHDRKQQDYGRDDDPFANVRGSSEWGVAEWVGAMIRASDKVRRLQTFARRGTLANEGVVDAFDDLAVYAVIARVLYEEGFSSSS